MVERARLRASQLSDEVAARIKVEHAEVSEQQIVKSVDRVLLTNELVLHALNTNLLGSMFEHAYKALFPGGIIMLDLPFVNLNELARASGSMKDQEFCRGYFDLRDGSTLRVTERCVFNPATWVKEMTFSYQTIDERGQASDVRFRRLEQRVWTLQEILFALQIAGFERTQAAIRSELPDRHLVIASKPGET